MAFLPSTTRAASRCAALGLMVASALAVASCSAAPSIEDADVPAWKAKVLPSAAGVVMEDSGKILKREPLVKSAAVPAGDYTLTVACDGGGKAFFEVSSGGQDLTEAGAACNGSYETTRAELPSGGTVKITTNSVDVPLLYAYQLVPAR
ncbi:hypothetical protein [Arthrobacter sp. R-11]|uniref:hypothetical protein n=1 Tax=Arthrobacter sp. R-11 TaxID=3404053 RepID=UPI003CE68BAD